MEDIKINNSLPKNNLLKINNFLKINKEYFHESKMFLIKERLEKISEENLESISFIQFKDPKVYLAISLLCGVLGIDRFLIGDIAVGFVKLFLNIWTFFIPYFIDLFLIQNRIKQKNFNKFVEFL